MKKTRQGIVYLVGAGPGDPKLLTLRGKECLERADVVFYDYLANPALLAHAQTQAERVYVGRRGTGQYQAQDAINRMLVERARQGAIVVRLKGGDPFVFGRGGEEAEALASAGVEFEVVPGVTAAVAAPAYAGIPVTHRTMASTVTFVTGHEDPSKTTTALEWPRLASSHGTLVFLMGMKNLPSIVANLVAEGRAATTPVALIRWGTRPTQVTVVGTLADIVEKAARAHLEPPTVIVVGEVVRLREQLNWFEHRPLFGKRVLMTRAKEQAAELANLLAELGAEPVEAPTIQIVDPTDWTPVDRAIDGLGTYDWMILTSVNGVVRFMNRSREKGADARSFAGRRICCIGPRTAEELAKYGITADVVPAEFQAEGVLAALAKTDLTGCRILIPRAEVAREILPDELRARGATVDVIPVYRTQIPREAVQGWRQQLEDRQIDAITFTSSSTVRNCMKLLGGEARARLLLQSVAVACIGPITAQTARESGLTVAIMPGENTMPALAAAMAQYFGAGTRVA
ncbi:uroporphyrinogen-III C-methyltransferase [Nitrospira sp. NS4]|uniref:uroporphyrinogen-III C-methyltransferase n=1 Tax=Nitrospira sp. NS4 TaxID=3414498 RepID=UPI003C2EAD77